MLKTNDLRLNETMFLIQHKDWKTYFPGRLSTKVLYDILMDFENHWTAIEKNKLGELLSLGGIRIFKKTDEKTDERKLIRLTLLIYRVLGKNTHHETLQLREVLLRLPSIDVLAKAQGEISHALRYITNMEMWGREAATKYGGQLIHYYAQEKDDRIKDVDFTIRGWCLAMVLQWLGYKAQKTDFWTMHNSEIGPRKYRYDMAGQGVRQAIGHTGYVDDRWSLRLRKFGIERTNNSVEHEALGNPSPQRMASMITACGGTHCTISQIYKSGGGHAMGAYFENGGVSFMDPNLGEFWFKTRRAFEQWFLIFLSKMDYSISEFYVGDYSVPLDSGQVHQAILLPSSNEKKTMKEIM